MSSYLKLVGNHLKSWWVMKIWPKLKTFNTQQPKIDLKIKSKALRDATVEKRTGCSFRAPAFDSRTHNTKIKASRLNMWEILDVSASCLPCCLCDFAAVSVLNLQHVRLCMY